MSPKATKLLKEFAEAYHAFTEIDGSVYDPKDGPNFTAYALDVDRAHTKARDAIDRFITKLEKRASK